MTHNARLHVLARLPLLPLFILLTAPPAGAALYKCMQDGAVTYADQACADTPALTPAPLPTVPALKPGATAGQAAPGRKPKASTSTTGADARRQKQCDKLALRRRWAGQDVRDIRARPLRPQDKALENALRKERRAEELYRLECAAPP